MSPAELHTHRARKGDSLVTLKGCDAVVYIDRGGPKPMARAYIGRSLKRAWAWSFKDAEKMFKYIADFHAAERARCDAKTTREAERKAFRHTLQVGDVLVASWGYDQTNIDYYQVTELNGDHSVTAREISAATLDTGWERGRSVPDIGNFTGKATRYKPGTGNTLKIASYASAYPLEFQTVAGARVYQSRAWTSYA